MDEHAPQTEAFPPAGDRSSASPGDVEPAGPPTGPTPLDGRTRAIAAWLARQQRTRHERDLGIGKVLGGIRRDVASRRRRLGSLVEPWERLVPEAIKVRSRVDGLRGDTLLVTVDGAATSWQLDRLLRAGLTRSLARASGDRVRQGRVRGGALGEERTPRGADGAGPGPGRG